jgi:hypothetical protein
MTLFELVRHNNTCWPGIGTIETPEYRPMPWDKPMEPTSVELRKQARLAKMQEWAVPIGLIGGALGIMLSLRAIKGRK